MVAHRKPEHLAARPRPASTVVLVREYEGEIQVYLLKRSAESGFMAGHYVFPGGTLEDQDRDPVWESHVDLDLQGISERLGGGIGTQEALAYGVAAIREVFEESGVLLARRAGQKEGNMAGMCDLRTQRSLGKGWLLEKAESEGWILQVSRLRRWSRWITPAPMPERYDTRFFMSLMPPGQICIPDNRETTHGIWINPMKGLIGNFEGELPLSPPTVVTLQELSDYAHLRELERQWETRPWGEAKAPRLIQTPRGPIMLQPWDPLFRKDIPLERGALEPRILPPGEPFSRIWYHGGIWRPVGA